jgi:hypothetical protein
MAAVSSAISHSCSGHRRVVGGPDQLLDQRHDECGDDQSRQDAAEAPGSRGGQPTELSGDALKPVAGGELKKICIGALIGSESGELPGRLEILCAGQAATKAIATQPNSTRVRLGVKWSQVQSL